MRDKVTDAAAGLGAWVHAAAEEDPLHAVIRLADLAPVVVDAESLGVDAGLVQRRIGEVVFPLVAREERRAVAAPGHVHLTGRRSLVLFVRRRLAYNDDGRRAATQENIEVLLIVVVRALVTVADTIRQVLVADGGYRVVLEFFLHRFVA